MMFWMICTVFVGYLPLQHQDGCQNWDGKLDLLYTGFLQAIS